MHVVDREGLAFAELVRPGDMVVWGQACAEPVALTERLLAHRHEVGGFRCFIGLSAPGTAVRPEHADAVRFFSYIGGGVNTELHAAGALEVVRDPYSRLTDELSTGRLKADVVLLQVSEQAGDGSFGLGLAVDYLVPLVRSARLVIALSSPGVPRVTGPSIGPADIDVLVDSDDPPLEWGSRPTQGAALEAIASNVAALVEEGATLQVGLGAVPAQVLAALTRHRDLGVHTGILTEELVTLTELGVVTNARKTIDRGFSVAALAMGGQRLLGFLRDQGDGVLFAESRDTHGARTIGAQHRFTAINSALQVDLNGDVNSEVAGGRYVGGVGGAPDFLHGAAQAPDGRAVVALPSTRHGVSTIVAKLGTPVSTGQESVEFVVTEHGVADLRRASPEQRASRLLAVADPGHREALELQLRAARREGRVS